MAVTISVSRVMCLVATSDAVLVQQIEHSCVVQCALASLSHTLGMGHHALLVPGHGPWLSSLKMESMRSPGLQLVEVPEQNLLWTGGRSVPPTPVDVGMVKHSLCALACLHEGQSGGGSMAQAGRPLGSAPMGLFPSSSSSSQELPELAGVFVSHAANNVVG